jgi:Family of unknown function (DUF6152)
MKGLQRLLIVALALVAASALAHHGWSSYDESKTLKLAGTIQSASYENPHGAVELKTPDKTWRVILAPPSRMMNRGLSRKMLQAGVSVTVEGYPHKSNDDELRAERITIGDKTVELR